MTTVSLELVKSHMKIDGNDDDELIALYIAGAEQYLAGYIGKSLTELDPFPADLKLAVLMLVSFYYEQRNAVSFGIAMKIAPYSVTSIADTYRAGQVFDGE
ncbi:head-tail connector protein [Martelella mediterranea]|uniref:head-tail connector protein n=1 Tax=Martelella mediterranea TaxID=293089 RepID=UPI001E4EDEA2|nr:head-tail connector protein [Martelella mediterranea]MCD1634547.1 head-tail connector protein [Martelella mediterranea]